MSQHAYFSKALSLVKQYRGSCESGSSCDICFTQDLSSQIECNSMPQLKQKTLTASSCDEGDDCYDLRLQNVAGCTSGWTLHGLWPQWQESCTSEKFDPSQVSDLQDDLNKYWPSCSGSAESFWSHEWSKHGTCSKMSQHAYFSKALSLVKQYRGSCESGSSCDICFTQDLSSQMECNSMPQLKQKNEAFAECNEQYTKKACHKGKCQWCANDEHQLCFDKATSKKLDKTWSCKK